MNRNIRILLIGVAVLGLTYYMISRKPWNNFKTDLKDFAIMDTASITRMFFADKNGNQVLLEKNGEGNWMVNKTFPADPQKVNLMKETMRDLKVMAPVGESAFNPAVAELASRAVKAEFYEGDKLVKTIFVGGPTPDQTGTFMMVEGSSAPFIIHIPGFVGYLSTRFSTVPVKWKDKLVFNVPMELIREVKVEYPEENTWSFSVENNGVPVVKALTSGKIIAADPNYVKYYLSSFTAKYFEGFDEDIPQAQSDSIRHTMPFCIMTVTAKDGSKKRMQVHLKPVDRRTKAQFDEQGNPMPYDVEKYFAFIDNQKEMVYIQDYVFGKLLRTVRDFEVKR